MPSLRPVPVHKVSPKNGSIVPLFRCTLLTEKHLKPVVRRFIAFRVGQKR